MSEYQGEKFKLFLKRRGISVIEAAKILDVARNTVYQYFRTENLTREVVTNIVTKFNTSEKEIFDVSNRDGLKTLANAKDIGSPTVYDEDGDGDTKFTEISPGRYRMCTELVPVYAHAGYLTGYADKEFLEELPKHYITVDRYVRGKYRSFEISGDSMNNGDINEAMPHGTIATGREVKSELWTSKLHNHQWPNWIFVHRTEGVIAKQIAHQDINNGVLVLRSLNPDKDRYPDFEVELDEIQQIYNVVKRELR